MLRMIICWNVRQMQVELRDLAEQRYEVNRSQMTATKGDERVMLVHQINLVQKISGYNADRIEFECIPTSYEMNLAIDRTKAKKGKVFVQGRVRYEHKDKVDLQQATIKTI